MAKLFEFIFVVVVVVLVARVLLPTIGESGNPAVACPAIARVCPDGTTVGATGPKCEFICPPVATSTPVVSLPTDVTLVVGQPTAVGALSLTLSEVVQDSRCPLDVQCIQAGAVQVSLTLKSGTQKVTKNVSSDNEALQFAGYKIAIVGVVPSRKSGTEIDSGAYKVTFHISR